MWLLQEDGLGLLGEKVTAKGFGNCFRFTD